MIKLVVFDMAGTTVEEQQKVGECLQQALIRKNIPLPMDEIHLVMGIPKPVAILQLLEKHLADPSQINQNLIEEIYRDFEKEMIFFYKNDPEVREKAQASATFRQLRAMGIKVALDTGFNREIADTVIERLAWNDLIDLSVTSDDVEKGRPYPDLIFKAMELAGVNNSQEVMKVGDTASDIQEGLAAQCRFVLGISGGAYSKEELAGENPTHLIEHLEEVLDIIRKEV